LPTITRVTYRHGLVDDDDLEELTGLENVELGGDAISREIVVAIYDNQLLGAAGDYGDPLVGDPLACDELTIEHDSGTTYSVLSLKAWNQSSHEIIWVGSIGG